VFTTRRYTNTRLPLPLPLPFAVLMTKACSAGTRRSIKNKKDKPLVKWFVVHLSSIGQQS